MTQNFKTLGLALVALLAMSAVIASAAQAVPEPPEFQAATYPAKVTGAGPGAGIANAFTITTGAAKNISTICKKNKFEGELTGASTTLTVKPTYEECKLGGLAAIIDMNTCDFVFHTVKASNPPTASAEVKCTKEKDTITITQGTCVVHVEEQAGLNHVIFDNIGAGTTKEVKATVHVEGIKYEITKECPNTLTNTTTTDGKYTEEVLLTGENIAGTEHIGIFVE
jgi:hypothetical protein